MKYTYEQLAKMIDHSLLHPTMTDRELEEGCQIAAKYSVATVCIKPYAVKRACELLKGTGATIILIEQYAARALEFAENCALLQRGVLSWHGESRTATSEIIAGYLGGAVATGV